jgi:hypothetical protein
MNKPLLIVAVCWSLCVVAQAAEPNVEPTDRSKTGAVQANPQGDRDRAGNQDRLSTRASSGQGSGDPRQVINPEGKTAVRAKSNSRATAQQVPQKPRQGVKPQDRSTGIIENSTSPKPSIVGRKQGGIAGSCIPMRTGQPGGSNALFDVFVPPKPESRPGQKQGTARSDCEPGTRPSSGSAAGQKLGTSRSDCEPMTRPSAGQATGKKQGTARSDCEPGIAPRGDATRAIPIRPGLDGRTIRADRRDSVARDPSDFDRHSSPLGMAEVQRAPNAAAAPGEAIERAKQRADQERERQREKFEEAMEHAVYGKWDKCLRKFLDPENGEVFWDDSQCKR